MGRVLSVLKGDDNEALVLLLGLHAPPNGRILDATFNKGVMWKGTGLTPHRMDVDPSFELDTIADFREMPFDDETFDVVVFDPPHLPTNAASENSSKMWEKRYGITATGDGREGDNVEPLFLPFLSEAKRVLASGGVVLAKIADLVHNHRYQWQHVAFINAARETGLCPCDLLVKTHCSAGSLCSSKWRNQKHLRKAHCYWIVLRKGGCERSDRL